MVHLTIRLGDDWTLQHINERTMRLAMRAALNHARDILQNADFRNRLFIRDSLGGLRAELWRDSAGIIQEKITR